MSDIVSRYSAPLILIVDADDATCNAISSALGEAGYPTAAAVDEAMALGCVTSQRPGLVVMDMDIVAGADDTTCRRLRGAAREAELPILILIDHPDACDRALAAGATDILLKQSPPEILCLRVRCLLHMQRTWRKSAGMGETGDRLLLKEAIDSLPIGITITDTGGRVIYANPAEAQMHGLTVGEILSLEAWRLAPPHLHRTLTLNDLHAIGVWRRESVNIRSDGVEFPVQLSSIAVRGSDGTCLGMVTTCEDISSRKEAEQRIQQLAYCDTLTGLANRLTLLDRLQQALAQARRDGNRVGLFFLDLDNFKDVNDTQGHHFGDLLLREVALRLGSCVRDCDTLARLGGDEFIVLMAGIGSLEGAAIAARRVLAVFDAPFVIEGRQVFSGASIGIALYPEDAGDAEGLLKCADAAMYQAKADGKQSCHFFSRELNERNLRRVTMENGLHYGLEREEFFLEYQPQWNVRTGRIVGVEALLRWQHADFGLLQPCEFIPLTEKTGTIVDIGEWVLRTACRQGKEWIDRGLTGLRVAVNISGQQLRAPDFPGMLERVLSETGLPPGSLELEFTEGILMNDVERTVDTLRALKERGVRLSIDDFGTGYSALSHLQRFPIDRIKIDRAFLRELATGSDKGTIVTAILALAKNLRIAVMAEGVETGEQLRFLTLHGCDELQGYFLARPMPADALAECIHRAQETLATAAILPGTGQVPS
jgi:diguanylate cyclase (GGDEF)-like protein/PAS domain S-box-containing protein